ncbi:nuclear transport factor 2 family protein [Ferruginibacter paludis]|uniref:nuclear transport factor 2 family protein n=1 Tax=Ferruginibacter paludis TaxID=1310417 RepID=UPI0025B55594|nr:nuclear transport factor 2 family protein [Ferruginibacter paludis]MDN3655995.1 nuclear transport factor 2 family protein [Ferruginibacter paludis]
MLILLIVLFAGTNVQAQKVNKDIRTIERLELDWHNAYVSHDINLISGVLADDFINLGRTGGRNNRQQTLENFRKDSSLYEYCTPYDFEYRIYKNTVIVLCKSKEKGVANGIPFSANYFSQDIFIKERGKWKCVLASVGKIPEKK